jgi:phosphoribosylformimino-5-aminoimidazole carboxamide ribotide isomerase
VSQASFEILPAIDLRGGRVVRLVEGDFSRETSYGDDPIDLAVRFALAGARTLHVVDLDGAREGRPLQLGVAARLIGALDGAAAVEVAGGMRTCDAVAAALDAGAARIVLGTAALNDPRFVADLVAARGAARIVAALDVRAGKAVGEAWRDGAPWLDAHDALRRLADAGVRTFEVTAIDRDGTLRGPDVDLLDSLVRLERGAVIASGGIRSIDDLRSVRDAGCSGAIIGRALYDGTLDLNDAIGALVP